MNDRKRSPEAEKAARSLAIALMIVPLRSYFLMLGLGVLHNDWSTGVPALGFWGSLAVALMITAVIRK